MEYLHLMSQPHLTKGLEKKLNEMLKINDLEGNEEIYLLTIPVMLPEIMIEQYEWYDLVIKRHNRKSPDKYIRCHLKKWKYITAGDSKEPMTYTYLCQRFKHDSNHLPEIQQQYKHLDHIASGIFLKEIIDMEKKYDSSITHLTGIIRTISEKRFITKQLWMKVWYLLEKYLLKVYKNNPYNFILEELKNKDYIDDTNDRTSYFYIKNYDEYSLYYNSLDMNVRKDYFRGIDYRAINYLKGETGYKGIVTGNVIKIGWNDAVEEKIKKVKTGSILVVPQTIPAYVNLITKCSGIITDEGGITGHASIICRELKIPCVIGTRIATKIFKDGDLIQLNGEKGIVKRI